MELNLANLGALDLPPEIQAQLGTPKQPLAYDPSYMLYDPKNFQSGMLNTLSPYGNPQNYINSTLGLYDRPQGAPEDLYLPELATAMYYGGVPVPHFANSSTSVAQRLGGMAEDWYNYYSGDNQGYRQYLSPTEQAQLAYMDYRTGAMSEADWNAFNQVMANSFLGNSYQSGPGKIVWQGGINQGKNITSDPFVDLVLNYRNIGGYTNPEGMDSNFADFMAGPFANVIAPVAGAALGVAGGPLATGLFSGGSTLAAGGDIGDALKAGVIAGGSAWLNRAGMEALDSAFLGDTLTPFQEFLISPAGYGVTQGVLDYAKNGNIQSALAQGLLSGVGDMPNSPLGASLGLSGAFSPLTYKDLLGTALMASQEGLAPAAGNLLGNLNFGTLGQSELFKGIAPDALEKMFGNVQISDLLAQIGGINTQALGDIREALVMPQMPQGKLGSWWQSVQDTYQNIEGAIEDTAFGQNIKSISKYIGDKYDLTEETVQDFLDKDLIDIPEKYQAAYEEFEQFIQRDLLDPIQNAYENTEGSVQDLFGDINLPSINLGGLGGLFGGLGGIGLTQGVQGGSRAAPEFKPFYAQDFIGYQAPEQQRMTFLENLPKVDPLTLLMQSMNRNQ